VNRAFLSAIVESQLGTDPVSTDNKGTNPNASNRNKQPTRKTNPTPNPNNMNNTTSTISPFPLFLFASSLLFPTFLCRSPFV
jgi:hypothetical protein